MEISEVTEEERIERETRRKLEVKISREGMTRRGGEGRDWKDEERGEKRERGIR